MYPFCILILYPFGALHKNPPLLLPFNSAYGGTSQVHLQAIEGVCTICQIYALFNITIMKFIYDKIPINFFKLQHFTTKIEQEIGYSPMTLLEIKNHVSLQTDCNARDLL